MGHTEFGVDFIMEVSGLTQVVERTCFGKPNGYNGTSKVRVHYGLSHFRIGRKQ